MSGGPSFNALRHHGNSWAVLKYDVITICCFQGISVLVLLCILVGGFFLLLLVVVAFQCIVCLMKNCFCCWCWWCSKFVVRKVPAVILDFWNICDYRNIPIKLKYFWAFLMSTGKWCFRLTTSLVLEVSLFLDWSQRCY